MLSSASVYIVENFSEIKTTMSMGCDRSFNLILGPLNLGHDMEQRLCDTSLPAASWTPVLQHASREQFCEYDTTIIKGKPKGPPLSRRITERSAIACLRVEFYCNFISNGIKQIRKANRPHKLYPNRIVKHTNRSLLLCSLSLFQQAANLLIAKPNKQYQSFRVWIWPQNAQSLAQDPIPAGSASNE